MRKVLIGVQARSKSSRLPGKIYMDICGRSVLNHVLVSCKQARRYINNISYKTNIACDVAVLCPEADAEAVRDHTHEVLVFGGSEHDVLSRYADAARATSADYILRVTADCPLIPAGVITKTINLITSGRNDYVTNVSFEGSTYPDGWDCEGMTRKVLDKLDDLLHEPEYREHVTLALRERNWDDVNYCNIVRQLDLSSLKLSIDTDEDFERVERLMMQREEKLHTLRMLGQDVYEYHTS